MQEWHLICICIQLSQNCPVHSYSLIRVLILYTDFGVRISSKPTFSKAPILINETIIIATFESKILAKTTYIHISISINVSTYFSISKISTSDTMFYTGKAIISIINIPFFF